MAKKIKLPIEKGLCKDCRWRFKRVFIPTNPDEFEDEEGNKLLEDFNGKTDSIVINICLLSEMDLDMDITTECSHYTPWGKEKEDISIFKHKIK
jgi:hypothetical protein